MLILQKSISNTISRMDNRYDCYKRIDLAPILRDRSHGRNVSNGTEQAKMPRRSGNWRLLRFLAAVGLCGLSPGALGQEIRPTWANTASGPTANRFPVAGELAGYPVWLASGQELVQTPVDPVYSLVGQRGLAEQVAELAAEVEELKKAGAKAKAKAAGRPSVRAAAASCSTGPTTRRTKSAGNRPESGRASCRERV